MIRSSSLLILLCFGACMPSKDSMRFDQAFGDGWDETARFEVPQTPSGSYDLFLHLRNDNRYPYANIFVIARLIADKRVVYTDTLEYAMASPEGQWLGTGFAEVKESKLYWRENERLEEQQQYQIEVEQVQRAQGAVEGHRSLPGIVSVGYSLVSHTE